MIRKWINVPILFVYTYLITAGGSNVLADETELIDETHAKIDPDFNPTNIIFAIVVLAIVVAVMVTVAICIISADNDENRKLKKHEYQLVQITPDKIMTINDEGADKEEDVSQVGDTCGTCGVEGSLDDEVECSIDEDDEEYYEELHVNCCEDDENI